MNLSLPVGEAIGANIGEKNVVRDGEATKLWVLALGCHVEDIRDECILTEEEATYLTQLVIKACVVALLISWEWNLWDVSLKQAVRIPD